MRKTRSFISSYKVPFTASGAVITGYEQIRIPNDLEVFRISIQGSIGGGFANMVPNAAPGFLLVSTAPPTSPEIGFRLWTRILTNANSAANGSYLTDTDILVLDRRGTDSFAQDNFYLSAHGNNLTLRNPQYFIANVVMEGYE